MNWQRFKSFFSTNIFAAGLLFLHLFTTPNFAQSTSQNFPTPVTTNEISGTIKARDLGDARLTTYFYALTGNQGDVFINVVTKNFDGDIDVFTADTLKPLTKIVIYSDTSDSETGRVIYLRQTQKMILRIEGRTPNDEPATFRIKFAGSFEPLSGVAETEEPKLPEVKADPDREIKVNSVGAIIEVKPKPTPKKTDEAKVETPRPSTDKTFEKVEKTNEKILEKPETEVAEKEKSETTEKDEMPQKTDETIKTDESVKTDKNTEEKSETKPEVVITDNLPKPDETKTPETPETKPKTSVKTKQPRSKTVKPKPKPEETAPVPNPLESIKLIVLFKDGTKIERPMSEVLKVSVDKGILTIINKDGSIGRYSILDVAKMTIE